MLCAIACVCAGAMENWGLVTYRETALLIDAANSSASTRQWVALVVGHERAHQWFGNAVTEYDWDDIEKVTFSPGPESMQPFGQALTGTVHLAVWHRHLAALPPRAELVDDV